MAPMTQIKTYNLKWIKVPNIQAQEQDSNLLLESILNSSLDIWSDYFD